MTNVEIAREFLEAMAARDFDAAAVLLAADAEVVTPNETGTGAEFLAFMRDWPGLDHLDISVLDRVITDEGGSDRLARETHFYLKESGDIAYEKPAEAHLTINAGRIVKLVADVSGRMVSMSRFEVVLAFEDECR